MFNLKIRQLFALMATATLFFCQSSFAASEIDSIGTGSSGSYNHEAAKGEGSKSKNTIPQHISGNKGHHNKSEGSAGKHHAKSGHGYNKGSHDGHHGHSSKCPFSHLLKFQDTLGLTEAQVTEIKRLRFEFQKSSIRNEADHKIAHMEFDKLVHAEKIDSQAILSAAGKIAEAKMEAIMNTAKAKIALLSLLTDEQRQKAHTMHSAHSPH